MDTQQTFLAAGQRYADAGSAVWRLDRQWTVVHVGTRDGVPYVTYRCANGHQLVAPADQVEAAVMTGQIVPVTGNGRRAVAC